MAPSVPTKEPEIFVAGTTLKFEIEGGDYPTSESWSLTYHLHPTSGTKISFSSSDVGGKHQVNVDEATTAGWAAGDYRWRCLASDGTDVFEIRSGVMTIVADPSTASQVDLRVHEEIVLDALETLIQGKALRGDQASMAIAGRQITRMTPSEIREWHSHYSSLVAKLRAEENRKKGLGNRRRIQTRFSE